MLQCIGIRPQVQGAACFHGRGNDKKIPILVMQFFVYMFEIEAVVGDGFVPHPIQIHQMASSQEAIKADKSRIERITKRDVEVAVILTGKVRGQMAGACRNTDV